VVVGGRAALNLFFAHYDKRFLLGLVGPGHGRQE